MSDQSVECVQRLRQRFLAAVETNPELYHRIDVDRVRTEDYQISRFVVEHEDEEKAYEEMTRVLKWKKSFGVHDRTDDYFPKELFIIFGHEMYSRDKKGRLVTWNIEDRYRKIADLSQLIYEFGVHQLEKQDRNAGPSGWVSVNDCSNAGMFNVDMSMAKLRTQVLDNYPQGMKASLNVDMPWLLRSAFKVVRSFMNKKIRETVVIITREEIADYVDPESMPTCFGGQRPCNTDGIQSLKPLHECKHLALNDKLIDNFYNTYKDYFQR